MRRLVAWLWTFALFALAFGGWALADWTGLIPLRNIETFASRSIAFVVDEMDDLRRVGLEKRYNITILTDLRSMDVDQLMHALSEDVLRLYVTLVRVTAAVCMVSGSVALQVIETIRGVCVDVNLQSERE